MSLKADSCSFYFHVCKKWRKLQQWIPFVVTVRSVDERYLLFADVVGSTDSDHFTEQAANFSVKVTNQLLLAIHLLQTD